MDRVVVIGAGVVGLACARALAHVGHEVTVLEAGPRIAEGVTSRNSGVIHSPLNYPTGSLKGALCLRGRELLYEWCSLNGVPHRQTGKLVVASCLAQVPELQRILMLAHSNGANEVQLLTHAELTKLEPSICGTAGLHSPRSGIIDPYELARSFLKDAEHHGATLVTRAKVLAVTRRGSIFEIQTSLGPVETDAVINSAGLHADEVAGLAGAGNTKIYPWRGDYFIFNPGAGRSFQRLIYPVKMKGDAGLGVHLTLDLHGRYKFGPDVQYVVSKIDFSPREDKRDLFTAAAQKLFPWVTAEMLRYDTCGIRPKLRSPQDAEEKDFIIRKDLPGWINLLGIESPGLTASMAIAERVLTIL